MLAEFAHAKKGPGCTKSALSRKYSSILDKSNPALLAAYMAFLKRIDAIHLLMFTMDIELFMEEYQHHARQEGEKAKAIDKARQAARAICTSFLDPETTHLRFQEGVVERIRERCYDDKGVLDPFVFAPAYTEVYNTLEHEHYPKFLQSEEFFRVVVGGRRIRTVSQAKPAKSSGRRSPKVNRKQPKFTSAERELMKSMPAPPSATEDIHGLANTQQQKKSKLFGRTRTSSQLSPQGGRRSERSGSFSQSGGDSPVAEGAEQLGHQASTTLLVPEVPDASLAPDPSPADGSPEVTEAAPGTPSVVSEEETVCSPISVDGDVFVNELPDEEETHSLEDLKTRIKEARSKSNYLGQQHFVYVIEVIKEGATEGNQQAVNYFSPSLGNTWTVERRYSEFFSLNRILKSYFPVLSAELPVKKAIGNKDLAHIESRKKALGEYLKDLLRNDLMQTDSRCTTMIYWFLQPNGMFKVMFLPRRLLARRRSGIIADSPWFPCARTVRACSAASLTTGVHNGHSPHANLLIRNW